MKNNNIVRAQVSLSNQKNSTSEPPITLGRLGQSAPEVQLLVELSRQTITRQARLGARDS